LAAISPASGSHGESLSTLRFAHNVKAIKTRATKNEEHDGELVAQLRAECESLRAELSSGKGDRHQLAGIEGLIEHYGRDVEQQLQLASEFTQLRKQALKDLGLTNMEMAQAVGFDQFTPQLINIATDPSLQGCLVYFLPQGEHVSIGCAESSKIQIKGVGVKPLMAVVDNEKNAEVWVQPIDGRVLVNGRRMQQRMRLRCGDRLIFGYAFCFRAVLTQNGEEAERQNHEVQTMEQALCEVMPEESEAYQQCRWYVEQLNNRLGATRVQVFLQEFTKMVVLVDEANAITKEVRPKDRFEFSVEVLVNLFKYNEEEPQCVVRLKKFETGAARFKGVVRRSILPQKQLQRLAGDLKKRSGECGGELEGYTTVAIMTYEAFRTRVSHLREACDALLHTGSTEPLDVSHLEYDPWQEVSPWEVPALYHEHEFAALSSTTSQQLLQAQSSQPQASASQQLGVPADQRGMQSKEAQMLVKLTDEHEVERSRWKDREREKDERIRLLEAQLVALASSAEALRATVQASTGSGGGGELDPPEVGTGGGRDGVVVAGGDLPTVLHQVRRHSHEALHGLGGKLPPSNCAASGFDVEEHLATAQLAHQVVRHLQDMKRDLRVQSMELELDGCVQ